MKPSILVVDDEPAQRQLLEAILKRDYEVVTASDGLEARETLSRRAFDLVITDDRMPNSSGMDLVAWAVEHTPETPIVLLTAHGSIGTAVEAIKRGAEDFLTKPLDSPDELRLLVARILRGRRLRDRSLLHEASAERDFPADIVAESEGMRAVLTLARQVAPLATTVLLTGESGTGKEVLARFIHRQSPRSGAPFVAVNCAALTESLLESELLGHEKGAFTGATATRRGRFELADQGTLFLDEVTELGVNLQAKLLRVLQEQQFERVGGSRTLRVDVRVLAATNRDPAGALAAGRLRQDLFYRLNVFPIHIPPLRERRDDLLPLSDSLLRQIAGRMGGRIKPLAAGAVAAILAHDWPGNVRELANALERGLIVSRGERIELEDLPALGPAAARPVEATAAGLGADPVPAAPAGPRSLAEIERAAILAALERHRGDRPRAAAELGISLRTLQYRLKEYGVSRERP